MPSENGCTVTKILPESTARTLADSNHCARAAERRRPLSTSIDLRVLHTRAADASIGGMLVQGDGKTTGQTVQQQAANPLGYCWAEQPPWSAYRESSFGHGTLDVINSTHALWCGAQPHPKNTSEFPLKRAPNQAPITAIKPPKSSLNVAPDLAPKTPAVHPQACPQSAADVHSSLPPQCPSTVPNVPTECPSSEPRPAPKMPGTSF